MNKFLISFRAPGALHPLAWAALLCLAGAAPAWAQAEGSLPEVTVSSSGLQLGASEMTQPVSVLEGDALVRKREATLGETLEGEPGISASHFGAGASRPVIRGMDGARVRVLSDGSELQDASTVSPDHAVTTEPLLATQVEVLRGPSALIHGAGAVGGVVNILDSKVPTAIPDKGYEGSAELRAGSA
ncbi:MAG TPA: TonB-dependent receptor plug domain-containing protein, partial [Alicycliphilus sp.]|nr:TonB-dependent receptor plug domain-containing protein [Alicycliphilus sp.]